MKPRYNTEKTPLSILGIHKGPSVANFAIIQANKSQWTDGIEVVVRERISRKKFDADPFLHGLAGKVPRRSLIAHSSFGAHPTVVEKAVARNMPFARLCASRGVLAATSFANPLPQFVSHHRAHARAAGSFSPFRKALIIVADGFGSLAKDIIEPDERVLARRFSKSFVETFSVYLWRNGNLFCLDKNAFPLYPLRNPIAAFAKVDLGMAYEIVSQFCFGSVHHSGKVMGLASFGTARDRELSEIIKTIRWRNRYQDNKWDLSPHKKRYVQVAAEIQAAFENEFLKRIVHWKCRLPSVDNLILSGGCALNCVANSKILAQGLFDKVYTSAFPGDESIGLGSALELAHKKKLVDWQPITPEQETSFYGSRASVTKKQEILHHFRDYKIYSAAKLPELVSRKVLLQKEILGLFRGRSEVGPRALGHRSLLADPRLPGIKDYLNTKIKFREKFRPYGATVLAEHVQDYFQVSSGFHSPFMNFVVPIRPRYRSALASICHIDYTCRIQTLSREQEPFLYDLIKAFGNTTGLYVLLHTSLNGKDEPIVETLHDLKNFFVTSAIRYLTVESFLIEKNRHS